MNKIEILKFFIFMVLWCCFCALNDYVLNIESNAYLMGYGAVSAFASERISIIITGNTK